MTPGVLTFQYASEDTDCAEGSLSLSWLLEAIYTWSLGSQRLRPAWLLRWCGLGVTGRYASAWGRASAWTWGSCPDSGWDVTGGQDGGLDGTPGLGFSAPTPLQLTATSTPPVNHYLLRSLFFFTISHQW